MKTVFCNTLDDTLNLGKSIGQGIQKDLKAGISIAMNGDLGAGKTTFVQGLADGLDVSKEYYITSPTFSIINEYPAGNLILCHMDLYRLSEVDELETIGFDDFLDEDPVIVVEWPKLLEDDGFSFDMSITIELDDDFNRTINLLPQSEKGKKLLFYLAQNDTM